jgi:hypothetical protein
VADARRLGLLDAEPEAALDSTGLSDDGRSSRYAKRAGRKRDRSATWPKRTLAIHTRSHLVLAATLTDGPSNDNPQFAPVLRQAVQTLTQAAGPPLDRLLADAGFDAEENHRLGRQDLGVRATVIALNQRRAGRKWPTSKCRRQMKKRFAKRKYRQRGRVESVISRHKRRLGWRLYAKTRQTQRNETQIRVLTHNVMIL